ncbi:hypothetical protein LTR10_010096 [Elasticomyces elasticus]|nr:hypothetical protein LTR10_010096 [Elasticomyces elasticus]KAK4970388.1 hypothetical protein LTR42_008555 [Elasticomyces elasticus]
MPSASGICEPSHGTEKDAFHSFVLKGDKGLIFLRNLKIVDVTLVSLHHIRSCDFTICRTDYSRRGQSFTKLERVGRSGMTSLNEILLVFGRDVQDMPTEECWPFPSTKRSKQWSVSDPPLVKGPDKFAFLPIQKFGLMVQTLCPAQGSSWLTCLQFLLHADFIHVGGRQDILCDPE